MPDTVIDALIGQTNLTAVLAASNHATLKGTQSYRTEQGTRRIDKYSCTSYNITPAVVNV